MRDMRHGISNTRWDAPTDSLSKSSDQLDLRLNGSER